MELVFVGEVSKRLDELGLKVGGVYIIRNKKEKERKEGVKAIVEGISTFCVVFKDLDTNRRFTIQKNELACGIYYFC